MRNGRCAVPRPPSAASHFFRPRPEGFMGTSRQLRVRMAVLAAAAMGFGLCATAHAASGTWTGTTAGLWGDPLRWSGAVIADGADATALFSVDVPATDLTVHLDSARTIGNLT